MAITVTSTGTTGLISPQMKNGPTYNSYEVTQHPYATLARVHWAPRSTIHSSKSAELSRPDIDCREIESGRSRNSSDEYLITSN